MSIKKAVIPQNLADEMQRRYNAYPTMLEALKAVDKWLMAGFEDSDAASASLHPAFRKAFKKTRAAIKLAEGEL